MAGFMDMIHKWRRERSLKPINILYEQIWAADFGWYLLGDKKMDLLRKKTIYVSKNPINDPMYLNEFDRFKLILLRLFPFLVAAVDGVLSFPVLISIFESFPNLEYPVFVAYITVLAVAIIELIIGVFQHHMIGIDNQDADIPWYASWDGWKKVISSLMGFIACLVIPILSLKEMYDGLAEADLMYLKGRLSLDGHANKIQGLYLRFGALAMFSLIAHTCLLFFYTKIIAAYSMLWYEKRVKEYEIDEEIFAERIRTVQQSLIRLLIKFRSRLVHHVSVFGKHDHMPEYTFSERVNNMMSIINPHANNGSQP